jgi:hypothetical protein
MADFLARAALLKKVNLESHLKTKQVPPLV